MAFEETNETTQEQDVVFDPTAGGGGMRGGGFRRNNVRKKVCALCRDKVDIIDFKDTRFLNAFVPERAKIMPRRISGNCAIHQRMLSEAIKRARTIALLPFVTD